MSTLLTARDLSKSFASHTLFTGVAMQLAEDDRLGFIGPNGAGKSTLLKILAGLETADEGEITRRRGLRSVYLPQDEVFEEATPLEVVTAELDVVDPAHTMDAETRASIVLSKLGFMSFDDAVPTLSGGWRKRLALARALVHEPDILMLDEPTNHLDLEGVLWLEQFIVRRRMAIVFVTHDRRFLENVARRIVELSPAYPGGTFEVAGNYTQFVRRKADFLDAQASAESSLANKVRRDTAWLQQGIQGRQTRNRSQVDDTSDRRAELKAIKDRNVAPTRTAAIDFQATERKTKKLMALHAIEKSMGGRRLFEKLDLILSPGRRIGLLGANGSGKTTLLRLVNGELEPEAGTIKRAADLRVVTFTQHRATLVPTQTLGEALCPIGEMIDYRGKSMHVSGWAQKFLFAPTQLSTLVSNLSGGEQARVLIANLMLEPADILLLDEPTNDLDIPSLEVLEQALLEFPGALLLVTHDRFMLERISTEFLALDGAGGAKSHASFEQWQAAARAEDAERDRPAPKAKKSKSVPASGKLSYKLQRDLDGMEDAILTAESEVEALEAETNDPKVLADHVRHAASFKKLDEAQRRVQTLYERWAELEAMKQGG